MGSLSLAFYPSCNIIYEDKQSLVYPCIKMYGCFNAEKFKRIKNTYHPLACFGELRIHYCITRDFPFLSNIITNWYQTQISLDWKSFNETIELPLAYNSLYDYNGICFVLSSTLSDKKGMREQYIAGANMRLFNSKKIFRQGVYELELHSLEPLGIYRLEDIEKLIVDPKFDWKPVGMDHMNNILKINRKHVRNELFETPLDRHALSDVERAVEEAKRSSGRMFLSVKFEFSRQHPNVTIPIIFKRIDFVQEHSDNRGDRLNPVDEKYFKMTRNARTADVDRARKPNKDTLDHLKLILDLPPGLKISETDGDLVWKYRFYLADKFPEIALAKFILSVCWEYEEQVNQAVELLQTWPTIAPEHVLELFNRQFLHPAGRRFAVVRLEAANDDELLLYLYQLVQALRYENWHDILSVSPDNQNEPAEPKHCVVQSDSQQHQQSTKNKTKHSHHRNSKPDCHELKTDELHNGTKTTIGGSKSSMSSGGTSGADKNGEEELSNWPTILNYAWKEDLSGFLIRRAQLNFRTTNYLYWFLRLETSEESLNTPDTKKMYMHVLNRLLKALENGNEMCQKWYQDLQLQTQFLVDLCTLIGSVIQDSGNRMRKIELLRNKLETSDRFAYMERPVPFPLNPDILISGIEASSVTLFKSFQRPALLTFVQPNGSKYKAIMKHGDDLRQDQLVLQMIELMDVILRKENFDLKLTPYKVLATSLRHGFVQFVDSVSLSDILHKSTVLSYLQQNAPNPNDPLGVQKEVMETYIRSCAGYCVITYLLGIGDRHMENLLLTKDGRLFHIDFSFILGADPKPMAPEVRLTRAMIDAMGGPNSNQFNEFWKITFTAFLILRRHANLFLTLFSLVSNMGIQGSSRGAGSGRGGGSGTSGSLNASEFLKEHFCLHQSEDRAVNRLAVRITDSIKAIVPDIMERMHTIVQLFVNMDGSNANPRLASQKYPFFEECL